MISDKLLIFSIVIYLKHIISAVNKITGLIPSDIGNLTKLKKIWLCEYVECKFVYDKRKSESNGTKSLANF